MAEASTVAGVPARHGDWPFLLCYALAWAGATAGYGPLLTLLLPLRVAELAGPAAVPWLATLTFLGAVSASMANIAWGWASDRAGSRRAWVAGGLMLSSALLLAMPLATTLPALIVVLVAWQGGLNMVLGPLAAWAADCVPDRHKGLLGGLLAFAPAWSGAVGALVTLPDPHHGTGSGFAARVAVLALIVAASILPLLLMNPRAMPAATAAPVPLAPVVPPPPRPVRRMWLARLLVQLAEATLFAFIAYWFLALDPTMHAATMARIYGLLLALSVPLALLVGHWADRRARPWRPLGALAGLIALGLLVMALAPGKGVALAGYALFALAMAVFLALHSGQTLRVLPRPDRRGRDLGLFNLTNTVPSLIVPWLAVVLVPTMGFGALFLVLAACAALAGLLLLFIRTG
ncbi:MFS transporter [Novosphingobium sp. SG919]|uniref:MFS transporter n=1 Tax=unclassified Novosphingobium TaxID=2644732 RepID=UPI0017CF142D|nr:MFS family permease [Novosphingobium sp. SG919]NMN86900.1 MFS family permease [Novosphingobium sp. SG916]